MQDSAKKAGKDALTFKEAYLDTLKENAPANNMAAFDRVIVEAQTRFNLAEEVLRKINFTDDIDPKTSLLTSRGLFIRVMEEWNKVIRVIGFESDDAKRSENLVALHLLGIAGNGDNHKNSWGTYMKRRLLMYGLRIWNRHRIQEGFEVDSTIRISSREGSDDWTGAMEEVNYDHKQFFLMLVGTSWDIQYTMNWGDTTYNDIHGFAALGVNQLLNQAHVKKNKFGFDRLTKVSGEEMVDVNNDSDETGGFPQGNSKTSLKS